MNNERFEKLIATLRSVSLSSEEKAEMFRNIKTAIASDAFKEELKPRPFYSFTFAFFRSNRYAIAVVCLVVLVFSSAGISQAADKSLPGDFLYPVKTQFNEKIKASFANTPAKKVKVESDLTIERLKEAEALSSQGKLDNQKKEYITKSLTEHSEKIDMNISEVKEHVGSDAALELDDSLGSSLVDHTDVLDKLSEDKEEEDGNKYESKMESKKSEQSFEDTKRDSKKVLKELKNRAEKSSHRKENRDE
ncbi:MAG: DUF5667 domain-containing protein [Candidatus Doudnabacteria bacterium]